MSCQFTWNYDNYKINRRFSKEIILSRLVVPVKFSGIKNNTLEDLRGICVIESQRTYKDEKNVKIFYQNNYNITVSNGNNTIGSLYAVWYWENPTEEPALKAPIKGLIGTVSCKGIFSEFNNGTAIVEFDNDTGKRCLTLYAKN